MEVLNSPTALEIVMASAPGCMYWKDRHGKYLGCNTNFVRSLDVKQHAIIGKTDYDLMDKELAHSIWLVEQEVMTLNADKVLEETRAKRDGTIITYLTTKAPLRDSTGQVIGIISTAFDISARKMADHQLREANDRLDAANSHKAELIKKSEFLTQIIDLLPCNVYWKNREGFYLGCNLSMCKVMRWESSAELVGKTIHQVYEPDMAAEIEANDEDVMGNNREIVLEESGYAPDGCGERAIYITRKVPLHNAAGEVIGLLGVSIDITERKRIEQAFIAATEQVKTSNNMRADFIQSMRYLENIIAVLPGQVYWKNRNGVYLGGNDNAAHFVGAESMQAVIGKKISDFGKRNAELIEQIDENIMAENREETLEEEGFDQAGNPVIYLTRKTPLHDETGEVIGLLGVSLDISDRKRSEDILREAKEKAEAANHAKSDFLAVVSHELRIPLTGILGMAQLLEGDNLYPEQREQLTDLIKSGEHLLTLINDLLDIAKLEAGKMQIHFAPTDMRKLIEEMTNIISYQAKIKGLELLVEYPTSAPSHILADARALRQIILNLTGNALKFTEHGHILIKVNFNKTAATTYLVLSVEDTGIGIPPDKLAIIFDRFAQADGSRVRRYGGTGLGLAITKEYTEMMGGGITVKTKEGQGTTFTCTIPIELSSTNLEECPWASYRSQVRILIVDDTLRGEVLRRHIDSPLCQATEGKNALNLLRATQQGKQPFDIVIIDQQLNSMDPLSLCEEITQHKKLHQPLLLLLAFKLAMPTKLLAKSVGFGDFLTKPIQPIETLVSLTAAWERWQDSKRADLAITARNIGNDISVLLVEDEPIVQRVHTFMLEKMHCSVDIAGTGEQAKQMFAAKYYDFVFLDIELPDINGFAVAKAMRLAEVTRGYTPIIGITGYSSNEDIDSCFMAGMDEVAIKPVKPEEFSEILARWQRKKVE